MGFATGGRVASPRVRWGRPQPSPPNLWSIPLFCPPLQCVTVLYKSMPRLAIRGALNLRPNFTKKRPWFYHGRNGVGPEVRIVPAWNLVLAQPVWD
jgi:hypothetical protein